MKKKYLIYLLLFGSCIGWQRNNSSSSYVPLTRDQTLDWIDKNIDSVLLRNVYHAPGTMPMPYRLFSPSKKAKSKLPLVVFLHGRGDRGTDNGRKVFEKVGLFMNEYSLVAPNMQHDYPCYVLIPQCSDKTVNEEWAKWVGNTPETPFQGLGKDGSYQMAEQPSESGASALALIDHLISTLDIDKDRVYLTGLSMGGFGTWEFTARRPELFAAAVPMAGFSDPRQVEKIKHIPFWIFHGDADESNPVEGSRTMYQQLKMAGAEVKYTEYKGIGHGPSFKMAYAEPELIPWIFSHHR